MDYITGIISAILGTFGFSLLFKLDFKFIPHALIGGGLSWFVYLLTQNVFPSVFVPSLTATVAAAVYSEVLAQTKKTPATVFIIPAIIPLVPGGSLYYTMSCLIFRNYSELGGYAMNTLSAMLGISMGLAAVLTLTNGIRYERKKRKTK